jgi:hypothetical protein
LGWANAAAIVLMGMAGGFVSGFLQARRTLIQPPEYEIDKLKFWLKPLAGGLLALILYALLSWQIVPAIDVKNNGSYFLMALLSGFSERYFLKVLELDGTSEQAAEPANSHPAK